MNCVQLVNNFVLCANGDLFAIYISGDSTNVKQIDTKIKLLLEGGPLRMITEEDQLYQIVSKHGSLQRSLVSLYEGQQGFDRDYYQIVPDLGEVESPYSIVDGYQKDDRFYYRVL